LFYISETTMDNSFNSYNHTSKVVVVTGIDRSKNGHLSLCPYPDEKLENIQENVNEIMNSISTMISANDVDVAVLETNQIYDTYKCLSRVSASDLLAYKENLKTLKTKSHKPDLYSKMIDSAIKLCGHHLNFLKIENNPKKMYLECAEYIKEMKQLMIKAGVLINETNIKSNTDATGVNTTQIAQPLINSASGINNNSSGVGVGDGVNTTQIAQPLINSASGINNNSSSVSDGDIVRYRTGSYSGVQHLRAESDSKKRADRFYEENKNTVNVLTIICASILTISGVKYAAEYIKDIIIAKITNQSKSRRRSPKSETRQSKSRRRSPKSETRQSNPRRRSPKSEPRQSKPRSKTKQSKLRNNLKK
jgi:hypothetical protein